MLCQLSVSNFIIHQRPVLPSSFLRRLTKKYNFACILYAWRVIVSLASERKRLCLKYSCTTIIYCTPDTPSRRHPGSIPVHDAPSSSVRAQPPEHADVECRALTQIAVVDIRTLHRACRSCRATDTILTHHNDNICSSMLVYFARADTTSSSF